MNQALSQGLCPGQGTDSLLHLSSPRGAPPQCRSTPLRGTACAQFIQAMGKARAPSTQALFSPFYPAHSSAAALFVSWPSSHHQLLGTIQSSFITGGWFLGHIWMAGR